MAFQKCIAGLAVAAVSTLSASAALAWSDEGHQIVGQAAYVKLRAEHPALADKFDRIYGNGILRRDFHRTDKQGHPHVKTCQARSPGELATWPDCVKHTPDYEYTANAHFDDIDLKTPLAAWPTQHPWCKNHVCASERLQVYIDQLKAAGASPNDRAEALAFVVHLVGDIHQPLHAVNNGDIGGNGVGLPAHSLPPGGPKPSDELHGYWDSDLVFLAVGGLNDGVAKVGRDLASQPASVARTPIGTWVMESHAIAQGAYYDLGIGQSPGRTTVGSIPSPYPTKYAPIVETQLTKAALRLEAVLVDALSAAPK